MSVSTGISFKNASFMSMQFRLEQLKVWVQHLLSVQSLSRVRLFVTPWAAAHQASLSITNSQSLFKFTSVMPSNHLILYRPLLLLPSIFPRIGVFSNESVLRIRWPKDWSFSVSISPSNEYSGLISCGMDWLDLLAVRGTLRVFSNTMVQKHQFFLFNPNKTGQTLNNIN